VPRVGRVSNCDFRVTPAHKSSDYPLDNVTSITVDGGILLAITVQKCDGDKTVGDGTADTRGSGTMKNGLLASIATAGLGLVFGASAFAADLDQPASMVMRPLWTGFYLGGFGGGAWGGNATAHDPVSTAPPFVGTYDDGANPNKYGIGTGLTGGLTVGYSYWFGPGFVAGLEAEGGYLHLRGSGLYTGGISNGELTATSTAGDWYGVIGGRLGYAAGPALFYVKGGAAVLTEKASAIDSVASATNPGVLNAVGQSTVWGGAVGGGIEWMFAPHWSLKTEYMYLGLSSVQACGVNTGPASQGFGAIFCTNVSFPAVQTGKIGVNYRF
jgi:outer membrane immunogenic protein